MRGTRAKAIRRAIYGADGTGRFRQWSSAVKPVGQRYRIVDRLNRLIGETVRVWWHGTVTADPRRRAYQAAKRAATGR